MIASFTPRQVEAMRYGFAVAMARDANGEKVPENEQCVNLGEKGCTTRAAENGWCPACWSAIDPS